MPDPRRRAAFLIAAGALGAVLALGSGLLAARLLPTGGPRQASVISAHPGARSSATASSSAPGWKVLPAAAGPFVPAMFVIDRLHIQAPVEVKGIDSHNQMQSPDRPADVAWYNFTSRPGAGSNAVFSGHRDFARVGPAIFWHLDQLAPGDTIDVVSGQHTEIRYRVGQTWNYSLASMPMAQVLAVDRADEITIITCSGRYTPSTGYDHRLVVRAVRAVDLSQPRPGADSHTT